MFKDLCREYLGHDGFYDMIEDIEKTKHRPHKGTYKGIDWKIRRPYKTYLCGYADSNNKLNDILDENDFTELEKLSQGGLTSGLGFDCGHFNDFVCIIIFPPNPTKMNYYKITLNKGNRYEDYTDDIMKYGLNFLTNLLKANIENLGSKRVSNNDSKYRNYDYVFQKIKDMIDYIAEKHPNY
jgi:hypothetical protein